MWQSLGNFCNVCSNCCPESYTFSNVPKMYTVFFNIILHILFSLAVTVCLVCEEREYIYIYIYIVERFSVQLIVIFTINCLY